MNSNHWSALTMSLGKRPRVVYDEVSSSGCYGPTLKKGNIGSRSDCDGQDDRKGNVYDVRILMLNARILAKRKNTAEQPVDSV